MNTANPDRINNAKNIEVRRVPPDWGHPTDENGAFVPLRSNFEEALHSFQIHSFQYGEEPGPKPDSDDFMPDWGEEEASHYQMYNVDSFKTLTPISPPTKTLAALADWLGGQGAAIHVRQGTLMEAARYGSESAIEVLLNAGADPNAGDGSTPLMHAAKSGSEGAVRALLAAGADKNAVDPFGWTALMHAAEKSREGAVKVLPESRRRSQCGGWEHAADARRQEWKRGRGQGPAGRRRGQKRRGSVWMDGADARRREE